MSRSHVKTLNPLLALQGYGQSVWLDYIQRSLITSGELKRLVKEDGVRGVTTNPSIFEKAIHESSDYTKALRVLMQEDDWDAKQRYEQLVVWDVRDTADVMRSVYTQTKGRDGYVSLEVSPHVARDTTGTLEEARRLWKAIDRDNSMIKVPATPEGIPAIRQLISEGINVNVTLLFAQDTYERVAEAYLTGLEQYMERGGDVKSVASVASFFISRMDTAVDALIVARLNATTNEAERAVLQNLQGKIAIANAKLTYQRYRALFSGPRWDALARRGAMMQRVLWASTGAKNPKYRDVIYIEELIGPDTVNTIPPATLEAFRDHGCPGHRLIEDVEEAQATLETLERIGISMKEVTDRLLDEGLQLFMEAFDTLLMAVDRCCEADAPNSTRCDF